MLRLKIRAPHTPARGQDGGADRGGESHCRRFAVVQLRWFAEGGKRRDFLIECFLFADRGDPSKKAGRWEKKSVVLVPGAADLDLRRPDHVGRLEALLKEIDLATPVKDTKRVKPVEGGSASKLRRKKPRVALRRRGLVDVADLPGAD